MALHEKITQQDLIFYEILKHPVLCGEFIENLDKLEYEDRFIYDEYQREFLCDFNSYVSMRAARAVGKTVSLVGMIRWLLINNIFPNDYICYHVPGKAHAEPVFTGLVRTFRTNSLLKNFIDKKSGINHSDMTIKLLNSSMLLCRIAGQSGTGVSVVGLHSPFVIVDESGYYPYGTWIELVPTANTFTSGYRVITSGVPTGLRERNVLWHTDQENENYSKHRVSALQNPRFTEEDRQRAVEMYGGEDSEDYIHLILGEHGKPTYSLFDRNAMSISSYPVFKLEIDGTQLQNNLTEYFQKLSVLPGLPNKKDACFFGIDLGYTEPTAIIILYVDHNERIKFHSRIKLKQVNYFVQEKIIDWLDTRYEPLFIGIDEGSAGKAVIPRLIEHQDFIHKNYKERMMPINFAAHIVLGTDSAGNEIKNRAKPLAVSLLQDYTTNHRLLYSSSDFELISELERMTYTKAQNGELSYKTLTDRGGKKGEDHFTSALLCATLSYYMKMGNYDFKPTRVKLVQPYWFLGG